MAALQAEYTAYERHLPKMLREHDGQYVVIKGSQPHEFFDTYEDALTWGYVNFGLESFFVKRVAKDHDVVHFTRDLGPCRV